MIQTVRPLTIETVATWEGGGGNAHGTHTPPSPQAAAQASLNFRLVYFLASPQGYRQQVSGHVHVRGDSLAKLGGVGKIGRVVKKNFQAFRKQIIFLVKVERQIIFLLTNNRAIHLRLLHF